jgi:hypothetical protein
MWRITVGIILLALGSLTLPRAVNAQQRDHVPRSGVLEQGAPPSDADFQRSPCLQELRTLGGVEG